MAGKNKIEKAIRILFDDSGGTQRDLSGDLVPGSLAGPSEAADEVEMTGVSDAMRNFLGGHKDSEVSGQFYMNDTASTGAFTVLKGMVAKTGTLTINFGSDGAAPTTGDPSWEGEYTLLQANVQLAGNKPVIAARWKPGTSTAPAWTTL